jgi:hypothetical protein
MSLGLRYAFVPTPAIVEASTGGDPHEVSLQVIVSEPSVLASEVSAITIQIPVGDNTPRTLSEAKQLPNPPSVPSNWKCKVNGENLELIPPAEITEALILDIPAIPVNKEPGTVQIKVTEFPVKGAPVTDETTYTLVKVPDGFPITKFWAEPATLSDLDEPLTLKWEGDENAPKYSYRVCTDEGWTAPGNCVADGKCYTIADGQKGVEGPSLIFETAIYLDVVETAVPPKVIGRATILVTIEEPQFGSAVSLERVTSLGGVVACMNWAARHVDACTLKANGKTLTETAPADTSALKVGSLQGYLAALATPTEAVDFEVLAKLNPPSRHYVPKDIGTMAKLAAPAQFSLPALGVDPCLLLGGSVCAVFSGYLGPLEAPFIVVIDFSSGGMWSPPKPSFGYYWLPTLSSDGKWLICVALLESQGRMEGITNCYALSEPGKPVTTLQSQLYRNAAFSLEDPGRVYLSGGITSAPKQLIEISEAEVGTWQPKLLSTQMRNIADPFPAVGSSPGKILALDGASPIVQPSGGGTVAMRGFWHDQYGSSTPDGLWAASPQPSLNQITVVAMATAAETAIPLSVTPDAVALSPDGSVVAVASKAANAVVFVDVAKGQQIPGSLYASAPVSVGIGTDGKLVVLESNPSRITVWQGTEARRRAE